MPATTGRQYRAMQAAAHGHSDLGIPADVGKEFADATPPEKRASWSHVKHSMKRVLGNRKPSDR